VKDEKREVMKNSANKKIMKTASTSTKAHEKSLRASNNKD